jgi:hypothetical protein
MVRPEDVGVTDGASFCPGIIQEASGKRLIIRTVSTRRRRIACGRHLPFASFNREAGLFEQSRAENSNDFTENLFYTTSLRGRWLYQTE